MKLLYGTMNQGKLHFMRRRIEKLGLEIYGLSDIKEPIPNVEETGNSPLVNARLKAETYYKAFGVPVFSCDSGLYLEGVPEELQPGVHVRRVNGKNLSDEEMISYYGGLAKKYGPLRARYKHAICLIFSEEERYESMEETLWGSPFLIVDTPHKKRIPGFPLDSLSVDIGTGLYFHEKDIADEDKSEENSGFYRYFEKILKERQKKDRKTF